MRKILVYLMALLTFVAASGAPTIASARPARWEHYGADRSYPNVEAAIADAYNVFRRAGWSERAAREMQAMMREEPTERVELRPGDLLDFMRTGNVGKLWTNVLVAFNAGVTAPSSLWRKTIDGVIYEVILPDDCKNLAGRRRPAPKEEDCVYLLVPGKPGSKLSVEVTEPYVDTDECKLGYSGPGTGSDGRSFNPNGYRPITMDAAHPCDWTAVNAYFRKEAAVTGCIPLPNGWTAIRLNKSVLTNPDILVILCLTLADGRTTLSVDVHHDDYVAVGNGVYIATVWASEREVRADYQGQTYLWWEFDHSRAQALMQLTDRR